MKTVPSSEQVQFHLNPSITLMNRMLLALSISLFSLSPVLAENVPLPIEESCECLSSSCGPCEAEVGTSFYSAKCGPGASRVKSCKKPTCEAVPNQKQCLSDLGILKEEPVVATQKVESKDLREPASVPNDASIGRLVGRAVIVVGAVKAIHLNGKGEDLRAAAEIFEGDVIETTENGRAKIVFEDTNEMVVSPKSKVTIEYAKNDAASGTRNTMLNLLYGRVRNKVKQKYDGQASTFQVKTRAAVAGVRGTDFVVSYDQDQKDAITEIRTFEGAVKLSSGDSTKSTEVPAGTWAKFTADFDSLGRSPASMKGEMSAVFKMTESDLSEWRYRTDVEDPDLAAQSRKPAASSKGKAVCSSPSGDFNQCSFRCEGNPSGEKRCLTEKPGVSCVRRICKANGEWTDSRRMPSSQGDFCDGEGVVVRSCGDYW